MQQSNAYIIVFTLIMTIFFGSVLSFTRMKLDPIQKKQIEIDTKKKILDSTDLLSSNYKQSIEQLSIINPLKFIFKF